MNASVTTWAQSHAATAHIGKRLPRRPVFGWSSLGLGRSAPAAVPSVADLPHLITTSGRAALLLALRELSLPAGAPVLVPGYHCPTMVAPVVYAGLLPVFFDIDDRGLPRLESIVFAPGAEQPRAMIVAHYFGLPQSLAAVAAWCSAHGVSLIEDCAHSLYGMAGERPVGTWGDYAIASLTKFTAVPEAGLLARAHGPLPQSPLPGQSLSLQLRGVVDLLETAAEHKRLPGINTALNATFRLKRRLRGVHAVQAEKQVASPFDRALRSCDMERCGAAPLWAARLIWRHASARPSIVRRRRNFSRFARGLAGLPGARPMQPVLADEAVPYVFPWWVDRADLVYASLRARGIPVLRWDVCWPGTPQPASGRPNWSRHVLQLLCHQDLDDAAVDSIVSACKAALENARAPSA